MLFFFFSSRRRHTRFDCDWSSDVCSSDLVGLTIRAVGAATGRSASRAVRVLRCHRRTGALGDARPRYLRCCLSRPHVNHSWSCIAEPEMAHLIRPPVDPTRPAEPVVEIGWLVFVMLTAMASLRTLRN